MKIIGKGRYEVIVVMEASELYELCGGNTPEVGSTVNISSIMQVVKKLIATKKTVEYHTASLKGHFDALNDAAGKIAEAITPEAPASDDAPGK